MCLTCILFFVGWRYPTCWSTTTRRTIEDDALQRGRYLVLPLTVFFALCRTIVTGNLHLCRYCPSFILEPMTGSWRCGTTTGTPLCCRGLACTLYRTRFATGCLKPTLRRSQLWLTGTRLNSYFIIFSITESSITTLY